jgi:hypothetical protein
MPLRVLPLDSRPLDLPAESRLPAAHPRREEVLARHRQALEEGAVGYPDPATGLFVLTAAWLADRGACCGNGCRHCPYVVDD